MDEVLAHFAINKKSVFYSLLVEKIRGEKEFTRMGLSELKKKEYSARATVAEKFSSEVTSQFYFTLILGECRRLILDSPVTAQTKDMLKKTEQRIDQLVAGIEKKSRYRVIPIKNLVQLQLGCLLYAIDKI